jgi:hypothetical protein
MYIFRVKVLNDGPFLNVLQAIFLKVDFQLAQDFYH